MGAGEGVNRRMGVGVARGEYDLIGAGGSGAPEGGRMANNGRRPRIRGVDEAGSLRREVGKRDPFQSATQEAYLSVQRTASALSGEFTRLFREHGLSEATYNVLRILRGALGDEGSRTCSEVGEHMVSPVPDVTRLVDRLEARGLVRRTREHEDKRVVRVEITRKGLDLLALLDGPVMRAHERQLGHMTDADLSRLIRLLARARVGVARRTNE
jgi:DNA-binding MarR family transcriptional regulator